MTRVEKALSVTALAATVFTASAQAPTDFSGHWVAVVDPPAQAGANVGHVPSGFGSGLGSDITITQSASTMTIERAQFSQYDIQPAMKFVYALDGAESRNIVNMGRGPQETASKLAWQDRALSITTIYRFQNPNDGKSGTSEVRQIFSLENPETLVVSATRIGSVDAAATSRQTFKKK
jgi:hypothetical protein